MTSVALPNPWQKALGQRLAQALQDSRLAHAPLHDLERDAEGRMPTTRWRLPARAKPQRGAEAALCELLGLGRPGTQGALLKRCLQHYRAQLAASPAEDDLGAAVAAYLGACRQAFDHQPLSPERWQAVVHWLQAWVMDELPWDDVPLAERQDAFERFATLAVALGEWTVQASRQGPAQQASATWMARNSLAAQLGLDLAALCAVLGRQDLGAAAANPSAGGSELGAAAYRQGASDPV